jgi:hypothetical protein
MLEKNEYTFEQLAGAFTSGKIRATLREQKVFVPSFDEVRIRMSLPFNRHLYVLICPKCDCVNDTKLIAPYVDRAAFTPVLIGDYASYPETFVRCVTRIPHIAAEEFHFYRHYSLLGRSEDGVVCGHCVELRQKKMIEKLKLSDKFTIRLIERFFQDLSPWSPPDEGLIRIVGEALENGDEQRLLELCRLSSTIRELRTAQAYDGRVSLGLDDLEKVPEELVRNHDLLSGQSPAMRELLAEELGLLIPSNMPADVYLDIVLAHRDRLQSVIGKTLTEAGHGRKPSIGGVVDCIGSINEEVLRLSQSRRFKAYRAAVSFAADHKAILSATLVAGLFGVNGSLLGCLSSLAGGAGMRLATKKFPLKITNPEVRAFMDMLRKDLQPVFRGLLARSLGTNKLALEVWQMRQELIQRITQVPGCETVKQPTRRKIKQKGAEPSKS